MGNFEKKILVGAVGHLRKTPTLNKFLYHIFQFHLPITSIKKGRSGLFSVDQFNFFSIRLEDYGPCNGQSLELWARNILKENGLSNVSGEIVLQTLPRILGYAFNPISFWFCYDLEKRLRAVICEVSNTFKERHSYLIAHPNGEEIKNGECISADKIFFVSPFFKVSGHYDFTFSISDSKCNISINYYVDGKVGLKTFIAGEYQPWSLRNLTRVAFVYPFNCLAVILRIHWQAFKLFLKGVRHLKKPPPPSKNVTK